MTKPIAGICRPALPGRFATSFARYSPQSGKRLTTKELVFSGVLTPQETRVNGKKEPSGQCSMDSTELEGEKSLMRLQDTRPGFGTPQQKGHESREEAAGNDDAFPDEARGEHQGTCSAERSQERNQSGFAYADAPLGQRQDRGQLRQRPGKEPDAQRKNQAAGDCEQGREHQKRALNQRAEQPTEEQHMRAP
jgi:hypothetical protein